MVKFRVPYFIDVYEINDWTLRMVIFIFYQLSDPVLAGPGPGPGPDLGLGPELRPAPVPRVRGPALALLVEDHETVLKVPIR